MSNRHEDQVEEPFGAATLDAMRQRRLADLVASRGQILNRLWAGNAGGAVATLAAMGTLSKNCSPQLEVMLFPLCFFFAGIIALGCGAIVAVIQKTPEIRRLEDAVSILSAPMGFAKRPSERGGLSIRDTEAIAGIIAGFLFVSGLVSGLIVLANQLSTRG